MRREKERKKIARAGGEMLPLAIYHSSTPCHFMLRVGRPCQVDVGFDGDGPESPSYLATCALDAPVLGERSSDAHLHLHQEK